MLQTQELFELEENTIAASIGRTPLLKLRHVTRKLVHPQVAIYAKAEWFNPGGSVKDRPALAMILDGERSGKLTKVKIIIDATSGNTGISYAMIGATRGYQVQLGLPANVSEERKNILRAYGATVTFTDPLEGTDGAQKVVKDIVQKEPERFFYADQYNNPLNWQSHYRTTGPEIISQTGGRITHFVAGLGTTGTFVGTSRRLKEFIPDVRCISFQPLTPLHGIEGLKHLSSSVIPGIYDSKLADENLEISTEEAYEMERRLANEEGLLVGPSSAAAAVASLRIAQSLTQGTIVAIFPDNGTKYLSEDFWNQ